MRLDIYLASHGFADSRQKAKNMITEGSVWVNGKNGQKPSYEIKESDTVEIRGNILPYVGRGGYKLEHALDVFGIHPFSFHCVDIGSSTGGFTDCLLQRGAGHVCAVDSGKDQLAPKLRNDDRVSVFENFNARNLTADSIGMYVELAVCDVSFISLTYIFEPVTRVLVPFQSDSKAGSFVALIKPQFEAGRSDIGKNGIVRDPNVHLRVVSEILRKAADAHLYCLDVVPSPITGGDGNREFLAHFAFSEQNIANLRLSDKVFLRNKLML